MFSKISTGALYRPVQNVRQFGDFRAIAAVIAGVEFLTCRQYAPDRPICQRFQICGAFASAKDCLSRGKANPDSTGPYATRISGHIARRLTGPKSARGGSVNPGRKTILDRRARSHTTQSCCSVAVGRHLTGAVVQHGTAGAADRKTATGQDE